VFKELNRYERAYLWGAVRAVVEFLVFLGIMVGFIWWLFLN
jgi:hypothetical protein